MKYQPKQLGFLLASMTLTIVGVVTWVIVDKMIGTILLCAAVFSVILSLLYKNK